MKNISVGDTVHYSNLFCKSTSIYTYDEAVGQEAKVIRLHGRVARLRWQDDSETSALLSNLEKIQIPDSTYDGHQEKLLEERAKLLLDAAIDVRKSWTNIPTK